MSTVRREECIDNKVNGSKRHSLQVVELSLRLQTAVHIVSKPPAQAGHADPLDV